MGKAKKDRKRTKGSDSRLEKLLALGKKKGFLTYEEINDFLPEDIISAEQIEKVAKSITCFLDSSAPIEPQSA